MLPGVKTSDCLVRCEGRKVHAARWKALLCAVLQNATLCNSSTSCAAESREHRSFALELADGSVAEGRGCWGSLVLALSE